MKTKQIVGISNPIVRACKLESIINENETKAVVVVFMEDG